MNICLIYKDDQVYKWINTFLYEYNNRSYFYLDRTYECNCKHNIYDKGARKPSTKVDGRNQECKDIDCLNHCDITKTIQNKPPLNRFMLQK